MTTAAYPHYFERFAAAGLLGVQPSPVARPVIRERRRYDDPAALCRVFPFMRVTETVDYRVVITTQLMGSLIALNDP